MKVNAVLKILNPILAVLLVNQAVTGIFSDAMPRRVFEAVHQAGGLALVLAAVLHVGLNWPWVKANLRR